MCILLLQFSETGFLYDFLWKPCALYCKICSVLSLLSSKIFLPWLGIKPSAMIRWKGPLSSDENGIFRPLSQQVDKKIKTFRSLNLSIKTQKENLKYPKQQKGPLVFFSLFSFMWQFWRYYSVEEYNITTHCLLKMELFSIMAKVWSPWCCNFKSSVPTTSFI